MRYEGVDDHALAITAMIATVAITIILCAECASFALASPAATLGAGPLKSPRTCGFPAGEAFDRNFLAEYAGAFPFPSFKLIMPEFAWPSFLNVARSGPTGTLEGKVTVGPLTPVERVGVPSQVPNPEVFTSRHLVIYAADGMTKVADVPIKAAGYYGTYSISLPPGTYVLDIPHQGIGSARPLPMQVTIKPGKATVVDVDIDTGIR
jgi:hypothetical protein